MPSIDERIKELEQELAVLEKNQTRIVNHLRQSRGEMSDLKDEIGDLKSTLITLGTHLTDGLLESSKQFQMLVEMNREQAAATAAQTAAMGEQTDAIQSIEGRVWTLENWRQEIVRMDKSQASVSNREQRANNASMAANALTDHFGLSELDSLIYDVFGLRSEPAEFGGTRQLKARTMVKRAMERGLFWSLINKAKLERPNALWPIDTGPLE